MSEIEYYKSFNINDLLVSIDTNTLYLQPSYRLFLLFSEFIEKRFGVYTSKGDYYMVFEKQNRTIYDSVVNITFKELENYRASNFFDINSCIEMYVIYKEYHRNIRRYDYFINDKQNINIISKMLYKYHQYNNSFVLLSGNRELRDINSYISNINAYPTERLVISKDLLNNNIKRRKVGDIYFDNNDDETITISDYMMDFIRYIDGERISNVAGDFNELFRYYNINTKLNLV